MASTSVESNTVSEARPEWLEKYSSAITLSDMEVFVFPELLYALVLANIMSPRLWAWREDPWFARLEKLSPYRRVLRLKQYIMDHYDFNLDLETWGLTHKQRELDHFRFKPGYSRGAGECVSLSTLYAAALFVVCGVPLEDIFLMTSPLQSQNLIDIGGGLITNNRRVLTRPCGSTAAS